MSHKVFTLRYITTKNCFCYLSPKNSEFLKKGLTLKISYNNQTVYLSSQPLAALNECDIGINYLQAKALNLQENDSVMVKICDSIPSVRRLIVSPATKDDYDILELLAKDIESTLLNQIRVVYKNQKFVIWISDSIHLTVSVDDVSPVSPGRLDNFSEVEIAQPKSAQSKKSNSVQNQSRDWSSFLNGLLHFDYSKRKPNSDNMIETKLSKYLDKYLLSFSLHPVKDLQKDRFPVEKEFYFDVFVFEHHLPKAFRKRSTPILCYLKLISHPTVNNIYLEENNKYMNSLAIFLHILEESDDNKCNNFPILYASDCIFKAFNAGIGAKVILDGSLEKQPLINGIEIHTLNKCKDVAVEKLKTFFSYTEKLLLNTDVVLDIAPEFPVLLKFVPASAKFCLIDADFVRNCKFSIADTELSIINEELKRNNSDRYFENFGNFKGIIDEILYLFKSGITSNNQSSENVLIVGKLGTGKTTLIKIISERLMSPPFRIHTETISCKNVKGKSLESLHRVFSEKFLNLIYYQPSVLILDDLHVICEKVNEGDALQQTAIHINRVSEMLSNLLNIITRIREITILATSESVLKLNQHIFASRGQHLLKHAFNIDELTKDDRLSFLKFLFESNSQLDIDLEQFAMKMDGFVVQDVIDFVNKTIFESLKEDKPHISYDHCETALNNTTALSLKDVQLHSPGERDFSDIGGLEDVKKVLVECLMWPIQYPNLFSNAPLRLQSGLLLYGPPGTGKTIIAGAAAKHCGLRLISIKGPELLSKYIGASEEAVRNVFEKAQSARPCILFFDEFDSLAPRRGHDSTGVTDRVVNQLLTHLDGVESLTGVCVLAATSRPDLLDPALLRPGRLDRQILCPLPNEESRLKILKCLSKQMKFASDVDLVLVSKMTSGYSGADLQAILYTAQLSAVEHLLEESGDNENDVTLINQSHIKEALESTRPSLTKQENLKYQQIYSKFQQGKDLIDIKSGIQRATLA